MPHSADIEIDDRKVALCFREKIAPGLHQDEFDGVPEKSEFPRQVHHHPLCTAPAKVWQENCDHLTILNEPNERGGKACTV